MQAYISVLFEKERATVTTSETTVGALQQQLRDAGLAVTDVGLRGRFHSLCHTDDLGLLVNFCDSRLGFQFLDASELPLPTRSNTDGDLIAGGKLHHVVLRSMLMEKSNWPRAFAALKLGALSHGDALLASFGPENCVPSSIVRKLGSRFIRVADFDLASDPSLLESRGPQKDKTDFGDNAIAVVGMSCLLPGATDLEGFWDILCAGKSQHTEVPSHRFAIETAWRESDAKRKWYGNFIDDYDAFDHKFFKKSPREMASTDPQHRLMLQAAYQAVEQSGYFNSIRPEKHIGCYVGFGLADYENNVACYPANAYSATGNLRSFAAGKISHFFGWTGPGLTIDTACSSSAVAVHTACKAILSGECAAALAGGVNVMTSPEWFQNLAGASFLSPTGQCKPFDIKGDGYCRGEGVGAVFLKKLSSAVEAGDQVFGVIAGSAVYQNQNCTAITVPNAASLSDLFRNVLWQAGLEPRRVSAVEAHGTGTPVGDPAEYQSISTVFRGPPRSKPLSLGSVKGLVGHTEPASGVISLLKTLLMINRRAIPPQASFDTINPSLGASPSDNIEIPKTLKPWDAEFRAALINNYGASGSNATLVVTEPPKLTAESRRAASNPPSATKYPFWFSGFDDPALKRYSSRFRQYLKSKPDTLYNVSLADVSFQVSRQSNRSLGRSLIFSCSSANELDEKLTAFENDLEGSGSIQSKPPRPVVLCFGGQISRFIGLDEAVYASVKILRGHLDECDAVCQSLGVGSFYPEIFQRSPIGNVIRLQTALFALQYSCAKSWIDCGVDVAAVVGHSFGELTALCISGVWSLADAIKAVAARARLVNDSWGSEAGAMLAVEASLADVEKLLLVSKQSFPEEAPVTIACFNGPTSFTLAGSAKAIDAVSEVAKKAFYSPVRLKKLSVTNAFHSSLVEPLTTELERLAQELEFRDPNIRLERATEFSSTEKPTAKFLAEHMRRPVFYSHAVHRLSQDYPSCIWLEAGSNSTITNMTSRALGAPSTSHFQPVNITSNAGFQSLTDATVALWKEGLRVCFWAHHPVQTSAYKLLLLPPYQFDKTRHWMELKKPQKSVHQSMTQGCDLETSQGLWIFVGFQDDQKQSARFRVNTMSKKYSDYVSNHIIAKVAPICPSTLQLGMAVDALTSLRPEFAKSFQPQLDGMTSHNPLCIDSSKQVWLDAQTHDGKSLVWDWKLSSDGGQTGSPSTLHAHGRIIFQPVDDLQAQSEFQKYERFVGVKRCRQLLDSTDVDEVIQGRNIYRTFSEIVDYRSEIFQGVKKIVGKGAESAGRVVMKHSEDSWFDTGLADSFCQVAGIFVNSMTDRADTDMYISNRIDQWIRSPKLLKSASRPEMWEVLACHHRPSEKEFISDVFIFDSRDGALLEVILGIHYIRVSKSGLGRMLSRLSSGHANTSATAPTEAVVNGKPKIGPESVAEIPDQATSISAKPLVPDKTAAQSDFAGRIRALLCNISGLEPHEIKPDAELVEIGIDSLMGMELAREIEEAFKCSLDMSEFAEITTFTALVGCVRRTLGGGDEAAGPGQGDLVMKSVTLDVNYTSPETNGVTLHMNETSVHVNSLSPNDDEIRPELVLEAFTKTKQATDRFIVEEKLENYVNQVLPASNELCIAYILDAFEELGCPIRSAKPGQPLKRIQYLPKHEQFVELLYGLLEKEARLIDINGSEITRTSISPPARPAEVLLERIIRNYPNHSSDHKLTALISRKLADCLVGKADGLQLLFGTAEGKEIASTMYGQSPINLVWIKQIEFFLHQLLSQFPRSGGKVKILEMGAGTGGTTATIIPLLASLGIPVQYTVTDISSSLVAGARKRFKQHSFMEFRTLDIEKPPAPDLVHSQHIILATNCVHATRSLLNSTKNIHEILRPDGLLLMLEMTETLPWVDLAFGLLDGWWLFEDGRRHALASPTLWEKTLQSVGYGHVDWTEGNLPEASVQRLIVAMASGPRYGRAPVPPKPLQNGSTDCAAREAAINSYVESYTRDFSDPSLSSAPNDDIRPTGDCVLVTGATGSLGSHLVAYLSELSHVKAVICLNRPSSRAAEARQWQALASRGISIRPEALSKLKVFETDTSKPSLGLSTEAYEYLVGNVTHLVHNAWPMSITRPVGAFEKQFRVMRNLIDLARIISRRRGKQGFRVGFQFISSIATVGCHPLWSGKALVPEERMTGKSVLPTGYGDAKLVCERMLDETLHKYPGRFCPMVVRIGQIAGSRLTGYWNPVEHFAFIVKSSQTLKALPDFEGVSNLSSLMFLGRDSA
jgi:acyl transferase domain-containing protein/acyl carrier protein/nucleoside-diphosphate-sugar epimerase/SAM-dependent methyltransferase